MTRSALNPFTVVLRWAAIVIACSIAAMVQCAAADTPAKPDDARAALESIAEHMVNALQDPAVRQNEKRLRELVEAELVPHIDFRVSSNLVLGEYWEGATESQRDAFIGEFRSFLVRFYTSALASHVNSEAIAVDIMSFRDEPRVKGPRQVFVRSYVAQADGEEVAVEYRMFFREGWKVIDVSVAGISMVQTYRGNFTSVVRQQGIDTLIAQLYERNQSFLHN